MVEGNGKIVGYSINGERNSLSVLEVEIEAIEITFVPSDPDGTKIVELPGADTFAWVGGVTESEVHSTTTTTRVTLSMYLNNIFPTYEEACTAEMKNKMENAR